MNDSVLLTREGKVATLTLNRPASLNTLDASMGDALVELTSQLAGDASVRCVVINGAGKHFMAGGDIKMFGQQLGRAATERHVYFAGVVQRIHAAIENLQRMPHPVVASVRGAVAGFGLSLMCACDLVVAADTSYFTSAYRHIGLTPDGGSSYFLPRLVGVKKAMEIILLGERFDAVEAVRIGLINRVVADTDLEKATHVTTSAITSGPRVAMQNGKRLVNESLWHSLSQQLAAEARSFAACSASDDFAEGVQAFLGKRQPQFGGGA
jgi:2-(1,2-epoxy-1,2-dihydrophenyl)acetyl-CoA isomerase